MTLTRNLRTLLVFLVCVSVFIPLILLAANIDQPQVWAYVEVMVLGWFAGAIIVGSHYKWN